MIAMIPFFLSLLSSVPSQAALGPGNACPDLAGTYKTPDGATFTFTSRQDSDGTAIFGYDGDTWIADGTPRDSHTGAPNPQSCPSIITCANQVLNRSYNCFGSESVEIYSMDGHGNIDVSGRGMGLNGNLVYTRAQ
jgi:hypothetical protein